VKNFRNKNHTIRLSKIGKLENINNRCYRGFGKYNVVDGPTLGIST